GAAALDAEADAPVVDAADEAVAAATPADDSGPVACFLPRKSTTSDLVRRPSLPEAGIAPGSSLFSSTSLRTEGLSLPATSAAAVLVCPWPLPLPPPAGCAAPAA